MRPPPAAHPSRGAPAAPAARLPSPHRRPRRPRARRPACAPSHPRARTPSHSPRPASPRPGNKFKDQFCDKCRRDGIRFPTDRIRCLKPGYDKLENDHTPGVWNHSTGPLPAYRVVNCTSRCTGPKVVLFDQQPTDAQLAAYSDVQFEEVPREYKWDGEWVYLLVSKGTLVLSTSISHPPMTVDAGCAIPHAPPPHAAMLHLPAGLVHRQSPGVAEQLQSPGVDSLDLDTARAAGSIEMQYGHLADRLNREIDWLGEREPRDSREGAEREPRGSRETANRRERAERELREREPREPG